MYYEPLKRPQAAALVDSNLVREIFYQIPEICSIHERFLQQLTVRVKHWDSEKKIGDVFVNTVCCIVWTGAASVVPVWECMSLFSAWQWFALFILQFSKCQLMDIYSKFIGNFMRAKASIEMAKQAKSVFAKFLEVSVSGTQRRSLLRLACNFMCYIWNLHACRWNYSV